MSHHFKHDPSGRDIHCQTCGAGYHCAHCNEGSGMMGHSVKDDAGYYFRCEEPERWARDMEKRLSN